MSLDEKQLQADLDKLRALVARFDQMEVDEELDDSTESHAKAFRDMLKRLELGDQQSLTQKQRQYLGGIHERMMGEPDYVNIASSGKLCRGREVETPPMLRRENLPMRPPKRKVENDDG